MAELAIENNESIDAKEDGAVGTNETNTTNTTTNPNLKNPLLDGETDGLSPTDGPTPTSTHIHIPMKQPNTTDDTTKPLLAVAPISATKSSNRKAKILAITVIVLLIIAALMVAYFLWLNPNNDGNTEEFEVSSFAPTSDPSFAPSILTTPSPSITTTTSTTTVEPTISPTPEPTMEPSMEPTVEPTISEASSSSNKINYWIIGLASGGGALCILLICCLCCCCGKNKENDEEQEEYNQIKGKNTDHESELVGTRV